MDVSTTNSDTKSHFFWTPCMSPLKLVKKGCGGGETVNLWACSSDSWDCQQVISSKVKDQDISNYLEKRWFRKNLNDVTLVGEGDTEA